MKNIHIFCLTGSDEHGKTSTLKAIANVIKDRHHNGHVELFDAQYAELNNAGCANLKCDDKQESDIIVQIELSQVSIVIISGGDPSYCIKRVMRTAINWLNNSGNTLLPKIVLCAANTRTERILKSVKEIAVEYECTSLELIEQVTDKNFKDQPSSIKKEQYYKRADDIIDSINKKLNLKV